MTAPFHHTFTAMTTTCELQFYGLSSPRAAALSRDIELRVEQLVEKYNFHDQSSWLNRAINARRENRVAIDAECARILGIVRHHAERVNGVFDISVGTFAAPLKQAKTLMQTQTIKRELAAYIGLARWQLDGNTLLFDNPHTQFDLGGVIKEFAVDDCLAMAKDAGISAGIVNFGGDLNTFGVKPNGERFVAAVQDPTQPQRMLFAMDLENQALATSGHYARKRKLQDGELSHVLQNDSTPATEQPWLSASVISNSTLISGIYSTSLLLAPQLTLPAGVLAITVDAARRIHQLTPAVTNNL
jgi:FAD:protein FMN transferase